MDPLLLSRLQFAFTIGFHYLFPPLTIGLSVLLVIMEGLYLKTKNPFYEQMTKFWVRLFALIFALGVATGVVMEFEFGTNWAAYSRFVGDVFGSALAAEGIFAFFAEAGFLSLLIFGWDKVKPRTHFIATIIVSAGSHFSAVWIVVANSWQQTPAGYHIVNSATGPRAEMTHFWQVVFNPSSLDRIFHVFVGAWLYGAFMVLSISAFYIIKKKHLDFAKTSFKIALVFAAVSSLLQLLSGDFNARGVAKNQPAKLAAMEGVFAENAPAAMHLFGWVEYNKVYGLAIPGFLSFLVSGDFNTPVTGLKAFPQTDWPPVNVVFQSYHIMIAIGMGLILLSWLGIILWYKRKLFHYKWILWIFVISVLAPVMANELGWITAEVGRQPYVVYNLMRTSSAFSANVTGTNIFISLLLFSFIYLLLLVLFIYLLNEKIQGGPDKIGEQPDHKNPLLEGHRA